jgi:three-Cys-motif partner protein
MATIDLHSKPFDESTITKLEIFEDYAKAWIPTFVMQKDIKEIHVFDFFSGPGYDKNSIPGSPIRILNIIESYLGYFLSKKTKIVLHLNEFDLKKYNLLVKNCNDFIEQNDKLKYFLNIEYYNDDAGELFFKLLTKIKLYPSLVYLDQNGIKFISKDFIAELDKINTTDFIYYVSSSYFWRFGKTEEFQKIINVDMDLLKSTKYSNVHRFVISRVKDFLPKNSRLKLFPFTLKKGKNIFGIIFGAKHYRAVDKFLDISWKRNSTNGEADFDIDEDSKKVQLDLFSIKKMTKIENFQEELRQLILSGKLRTNEEVLIYTYENGHIPKHASDLIKSLKKQNFINYIGKTPGINYDNVYKKRNIIEFQIIN